MMTSHQRIRIALALDHHFTGHLMETDILYKYYIIQRYVTPSGLLTALTLERRERSNTLTHLASAVRGRKPCGFASHTWV